MSSARRSAANKAGRCGTENETGRWRKLLPDSVIGRTTLVLVIGLAVSHSASHWVDSGDPYRTVLSSSADEVAAFVGRVAAAMEAAPANTRPAIADAASRPLAAIAWEPAMLPDVDGSPDHRLFSAFPESMRPRLRIEPLPTATWPMEGEFADNLRTLQLRLPEGEAVAVRYRLEDGSILAVTMLLVDPPSFWAPRTLASNLLLLATVIAVSLWAATWIARPLSTLARAAELLGHDVNAPALPEKGPFEVRSAARSFNGMQRQLQRLIVERTYMLAGFSHDLRTPITRLRFRLELVADAALREKAGADLDEMEAMIAACLRFAREEAPHQEREEVDLGAMVQTICENLADSGEAVEYQGDGRVIISCHPLSLRRALTNLMDNAVKYGGCARVRMEAAADKVEIVIDDDGPGIPAAKHETAFAPFGRLEQSRSRQTGGIGLGLSVARLIIAAHDGEIRLENRAGGGLRQRIVLRRSATDCHQNLQSGR